MKVSGFTIIRNGNLYAYPYKEAILSVLPLCDEFVVNVGVSKDGTLDSIKEIDDDRIRIIESEWDMSIREGGKVLSIETNKALDKCTGDWCFYIQGDEVMHEKYIPVVKDAMKKFLDSDTVHGLQFWYKHFYGTYDYYQDNNRKWYRREVRVIKNNKNIVSWGDAMDFKYRDGSDISRKQIDAEIYHYGWVKPPEKMLEKRKDFQKLWLDDEEVNKIASSIQSYDDLGNLKHFEETHPAVMKERIESSNWDFDAKIEEQPPDWVRKVINFMHPVTKRVKRLLGKESKPEYTHKV